MSRQEFSAKTREQALERCKDASGIPRCDASGCDRPARGNTPQHRLCGMHYQRWAKYGSTELPNPRMSPDGLCTMVDCRTPIRSGNSAFCHMHYTRLLRASQPTPSKPPCKHCGGPLPQGRWVFCSSRCTWRAYNGTPNERPCAECGRVYSVAGRSVCCSDACRQARIDRIDREFRAQFAASEEGKTRFRDREYRRKASKSAVACEHFGRDEIFERDGWRCGLCGKKVSKTAEWPAPSFATLDHILPLSKGGAHTRANTQTAHLRCNLVKGARAIGQARLF